MELQQPRTVAGSTSLKNGSGAHLQVCTIEVTRLVGLQPISQHAKQEMAGQVSNGIPAC
jgi:hypothetical protein